MILIHVSTKRYENGTADPMKLKSFKQFLYEQDENALSDKQVFDQFAHPVRDESGNITGVRFRLVGGQDELGRDVHSHIIDRSGNRVRVNFDRTGYSGLGLQIGRVIRKSATQLGHELSGGALIRAATPVEDSEEHHITMPVPMKQKQPAP